MKMVILSYPKRTLALYGKKILFQALSFVRKTAFTVLFQISDKTSICKGLVIRKRAKNSTVFVITRSTGNNL